eukprot:gene7554-10293_t
MELKGGVDHGLNYIYNSSNNPTTINAPSLTIPTTPHSPTKHQLLSNMNRYLQRESEAIVRYQPFNPIFSYCVLAFAPPLDVLKRTSEISVINKKKQNSSLGIVSQPSSTGTRTSKYWLCLHNLKLMFFQYYGDANPRFISDISEANAVFARDMNSVSFSVYLHHADQRIWGIEFQLYNDAARFEYAVNQSRKILTQESNMKIVRSISSSTDSISYGFNQLIY